MCVFQYDLVARRNHPEPDGAPSTRPRLFGAAGTTDPKVLAALRQEDRSILDAVNEDVRRLRAKLGGKDRGKIDQYTEAVRDVERRIQRA